MITELKSIQLRPGDIFCTKNPMWFGKAINAMQSFWARDQKSTYSHTGIIMDRQGSTLESLWFVSRQNIFEAYRDMNVIIGRHESMNTRRFINGYKNIQQHEGQFYPFYRLFFHIFPPIARRVGFGRLVCSELAAKFAIGANVLNCESPLGINPDTWADIFEKYKGWKIIFKGNLSKWQQL